MEHKESEKYIKNAEALQLEGNNSEAIVSYLKSLEFEPENLITWYKLGLIYHDMNNFTKAIECYEKVLGYAPDFTDAIFSSANAYYSLGDVDRAMDLYQVGLEKAPDMALSDKISVQ